jgi:hypothetical protein
MSNTTKNNIKIAITIILLTTTAIVISNCSQKKDNYKQTIAPPVPNADIQFKKTAVNADSNVVIESPTGTKIKIKPQTFISKNGTPVKGKVDFKFREFHNAYDILRSGIPMSTDQNRNNFLESAGMIELRAYQNNEELSIDPKKNVEIELASFKPSDSYDLYYLDNNTDWKTKDSFETGVNVSKQQKLKRLSNIPPKPYNEDSTQEIVFDLSSNLTEAPYLKPFKDMQWRINPKDATPAIINAMRVNWDEVSIKELNHRKMIYELTFKKEIENPTSSGNDFIKTTNSIVVKATPFLHEKNIRQNRKAFAVQMKVYNDIIAKVEDEKMRVSKEADLVNTFKINKMGIWNIDKFQKKEELIFTKVSFDFEKEIDPEINHVKIFVVYEDDNSVIQYLPKDFNKIGITKDKKISIIAVLPNNKLAVVNNDAIKKQIALKNEKIYLVTNKVEANSYLSNFDMASK